MFFVSNRVSRSPTSNSNTSADWDRGLMACFIIFWRIKPYILLNRTESTYISSLLERYKVYIDKVKEIELENLIAGRVLLNTYNECSRLPNSNTFFLCCTWEIKELIKHIHTNNIDIENNNLRWSSIEIGHDESNLAQLIGLTNLYVPSWKLWYWLNL